MSFACAVAHHVHAHEHDDFDGEPSDRSLDTSHEQAKLDICDEICDNDGVDEHRKRLMKVFRSTAFEVAIGVVIFLNMFIVIIETDTSAGGSDPPVWLSTANLLLLSIYIVELVTKLYIFRRYYFSEPWNILDMSIVGLDVTLILVGWIVSDLPSVSMFRIIRLARLARTFKAASFLTELNYLILGFIGAVKAIFWGMAMIVMMLTLWGILAVQLIHPVNERVTRLRPEVYDGCARCPQAFGSVFASMLTLFQQLVAGDSWGLVSVPIIEQQPWTAVFFMAVLVTVSLTMLNLVLTVIIDASANTREQSIREQEAEHARSKEQARAHLLELCEELDQDKSGSLSSEELCGAFDTNQVFANILKSMEIDRKEMELIFLVLDQDGSGDIAYVEFVEQLERLKTHAGQLVLFYVAEMRHVLKALSKSVYGEHAVAAKDREFTLSGNNPADFWPNSPRAKSDIPVQVLPQSAWHAVELPFPPSPDVGVLPRLKSKASVERERESTDLRNDVTLAAPRASDELLRVLKDMSQESEKQTQLLAAFTADFPGFVRTSLAACFEEFVINVDKVQSITSTSRVQVDKSFMQPLSRVGSAEGGVVPACFPNSADDQASSGVGLVKYGHPHR